MCKFTQYDSSKYGIESPPKNDELHEIQKRSTTSTKRKVSYNKARRAQVNELRNSEIERLKHHSTNQGTIWNGTPASKLAHEWLWRLHKFEFSIYDLTRFQSYDKSRGRNWSQICYPHRKIAEKTTKWTKSESTTNRIQNVCFGHKLAAQIFAKWWISGSSRRCLRRFPKKAVFGKSAGRTNLEWPWLEKIQRKPSSHHNFQPQ